jgi:two-component system competent response regulator ComA
MIQVLLVDDHPAVMEGTKMLLEQEEDMKVTMANTGARAIELVGSNRYDVMLVDLNMPDMNGIEFAKQVLEIAPDAVILIYTGFEYQSYFNVMVESGISGFVLKTAYKEQLVTSVRCALRGEVTLPLSLVKQLRTTSAQPDAVMDPKMTINSKELRILKEIADGKSNKEIADSLITSQRALEYSLTNLFHKLNVKSRFEAAVKAKQLGLFDESDYRHLNMNLNN